MHTNWLSPIKCGLNYVKILVMPFCKIVLAAASQNTLFLGLRNNFKYLIFWTNQEAAHGSPRTLLDLSRPHPPAVPQSSTSPSFPESRAWHTSPLSPSIHIQIQFCRLPHPSPAPPSPIAVADPRAPTLRSLFSRGLTSYPDPPLEAV